LGRHLFAQAGGGCGLVRCTNVAEFGFWISVLEAGLLDDPHALVASTTASR
jgi:hypothetical protein